MKKLNMTILLICLSVFVASAAAKVKILNTSGDVKIRRGVEESWQNAKAGMLLEEIDTILSGETGNAKISLPNGKSFKLGKNMQLDITDLKPVSSKEMMLYLMSRKIQKINPGTEKRKLRVGNVSVVHGESKNRNNPGPLSSGDANFWIKEKNGAKALFNHELYPNTVIKLNKILSKYNSPEDGGEIHYYLAKSFEALQQNGQAIDAYEVIITKYEDSNKKISIKESYYIEAKSAVKNLKKEQK